MNLLLTIADFIATAILLTFAVSMGRAAWAERSDRGAFGVGAGVALVAVLIALRLAFK